MLAMVTMLLLFGKDSHGEPVEWIDLRHFKELSLMVSRQSLCEDEPNEFPFSSPRAWASTACSSNSADSPLSTTTMMSCYCAIRCT